MLFSFGQGEIEKQKKILFKNERTYGLLLNSNGLGFNFLYAKYIDGFQKRLYSAEFNWIRHPKEVRTVTDDFNSRSYIFGKLNSFYTLNLSMGYQKEIFGKSDKRGIAIRYFALAGPSIGILKPKYYEIGYNPNIIKTEDFNTFYENLQSTHNSGIILGNASFSKGLDEIKIEPGLFAKVGLSFEYAERETIISALELGITLQAYTRKVPMMALETNSRFFPGVFLSYRFGNSLDQRPKNLPPSVNVKMESIHNQEKD